MHLVNLKCSGLYLLAGQRSIVLGFEKLCVLFAASVFEIEIDVRIFVADTYASSHFVVLEIVSAAKAISLAKTL